MWDYGIEAGGPLWKDRLWLWGAFATTPSRADASPTGRRAHPEPADLRTVLEREAECPARSPNALTLSYTNFEEGRRAVAVSPDLSEESTWDISARASPYKIEDSQVLSANLFASFYLSYVKTSTSLPSGARPAGLSGRRGSGATVSAHG